MKHSYLICLLLAMVFTSCMKSEKADLVIHNAVIYSMDEGMKTYEAMAVKDGKILELGPERQILNKYKCDNVIDAKGRDVYPGLTDAHVHLLLAAKQRMGIDLSQSKSYPQMVTEVEIYSQAHPSKVIVGHGWNESNWRDQTMPNNELLNKTFPSTPVILYRNDGHTALANQALLDIAGITSSTQIENGEIHLLDGKMTGILTDAAMDLVKKQVPSPSLTELTEKLIEIQNELFMYGITNVHDAGLEAEEVQHFIQLIDNNRLKLNIYGMLLPTKANIDFAKKHGIFTHKNLSIRSFKVFADGSLGSHGAHLKQPYADAPHTLGTATVNQEELNRLVKMCQDLGYQLNTHAIGDASVKMVLESYKHVRDHQPDHRWRMEHAQVIDPNDLPLFVQYGVFPSVQPTHAMSDAAFAEKRLGTERLKGAYAYQSLLNTTGIIALGTDFPIESMDPFATIYAATMRKNTKEQPEGGFKVDEAISFEDCMRGMTLWAAMAAFEENRLGKLEVGMDATFVLFERKVQVGNFFTPNFALLTYIKGEQVYSAE